MGLTPHCMRWATILLSEAQIPNQFCCLQVTDAGSPENNTMLDYTKHHSLEGVELGKLRRSANRITAHTDESLITLLLHSPGKLCLL